MVYTFTVYIYDFDLAVGEFSNFLNFIHYISILTKRLSENVLFTEIKALENCAGILEQSMGARKRVGIGLLQET